MTKREVGLYDDAWVCETQDVVGESVIDHGDVDIYSALALQTGGTVLELACGAGRVVLPLARAGHRVTGLDNSPHQLAVAQRKLQREPAEVRARVCLLEGDMSCFDLGERFGLIVIAARSFQCLLERVQQRSCLQSCAAHLHPKGRLAIDVFNPRLSRLIAEGGVGDEREKYAGPDGATIRESDHTDYDIAEQRLLWRTRHECTAADGQVTVHECALPLHYFFRYEMEWMFEACGFDVEALYGDFDRSAFTAQSPEMFFVAKKRED